MDILAQVNEIDVEVAGEFQEGFLVASVKNVGQERAIVNGVTLAPGEAKGYPLWVKAIRKSHTIQVVALCV